MSKVTRLPAGQRGANARPELHPREVPGESDVGDASVGQDVRTARLKRGDDLASVSRALRIRKEYLEALETDSPDRLPGRTYAVGFLRSYADYLGLDSPGLVSRYKRQTGEQSETSSPAGTSHTEERSRSPFAAAAISIVVLGTAAYVLYQVYQPQIFGRPGPSPSTIATAGVGAVRRVSQSHLGAGTHVAGVSVAALRVPSNLPVQQQISEPEGQVFGAQNRDARIVLHALGLTHVLVQDFSGKIYINRLLHPGDVYRVPNLVGLSLTTQDGGAVSVELDGQDRGLVGRSGQITEALSLDPGAITGRRAAGSIDVGDKVTP